VNIPQTGIKRSA